MSKEAEMEVTHTAEPWDIYAQPINGAGDAILELVEQVQQTAPMANAIYLLNAGGKCPATTGCGRISEANARRIVACVNACAGIDDPANFIATARAESAALRVLLRECQDKLGDIVMGEGLHPDDAVTLHAKIDQALAQGSQP